MQQSKKNHFDWAGINKAGYRINGSLRANSKQEAIQAIMEKQITLLTIKKIKHYQIYKINFSYSYKLKKKDIIHFTQELALLLKSNISLLQSLLILKQTNHLGLKKLINSIIQSLEAGNSLTQTLKNHPQYFDAIYISMIHAGEESAKLDIMLTNLHNYQNNMSHLLTAIKKAIRYPLILLTTACLILTGMLMFVIPQFVNLFAHFQATLPKPTLLLITLSQQLQSYWWEILSSIILLIICSTKAYQFNTPFQQFSQAMLCKLPLIRQLIQAAFLARWSMMVSTMLSTNIPLLIALKISKETTKLICYQQAIQSIIHQVNNGVNLATALRDYPNIFSSHINTMVQIGEESHSLHFMLDHIAKIKQQQIDNIIINLNSSLEPVIMIIISLIISLMLIAIYLPIFKVGRIV